VQVIIDLLQHGADIEAKDNDGWTPLHMACCEGPLSVVIELVSPNDSNDATTTILGKRKTRGADIEAKNIYGDTPLHFASGGGHLPAVKALLAVGANFLAANNQGEIPINYAVI
jgi:ankyrin repeat protein